MQLRGRAQSGPGVGFANLRKVAEVDSFFRRRRHLHLVRPEDEANLPKASLWLRACARVVDCAVAWVAFRGGGVAGPLLALSYVLLADGFANGQSIGKRLFGVKVVSLATGRAALSRDSAVRNAPLGLLVVLYLMPELGEEALWLSAPLVGVVEGLAAFRSARGCRLGDRWAATQVVDGSVPIDQHALTAGDRGQRRQAVRQASPV